MRLDLYLLTNSLFNIRNFQMYLLLVIQSQRHVQKQLQLFSLKHPLLFIIYFNKWTKILLMENTMDMDHVLFLWEEINLCWQNFCMVEFLQKHFTKIRMCQEWSFTI